VSENPFHHLYEAIQQVAKTGKPQYIRKGRVKTCGGKYSLERQARYVKILAAKARGKNKPVRTAVPHDCNYPQLRTLDD
jgi:hypothetical protein